MSILYLFLGYLLISVLLFTILTVPPLGVMLTIMAEISILMWE